VKKLLALAAALSAAASFCSRPAAAAVIDFETTPAPATPVDDAFLSSPYNIVGGGTVAFFFDVNGNNSFDPATDQRPVFEAYGPDANNGFANGLTGLDDTANGGLAGQLGSFFLRQLQPGAPPPPFIVDYNTAQVITGLHGEIWDIDGAPTATEGWLVEVLDGSNNLLTSQLSPLGNNQSLDGLPWDFSFSGLPAGVDKLRITFVGSKTTGLGLAFNNFDPTTAAPEPGAMLVLIGGAGVLTRSTRRHGRPGSR
jgi:hypothetical protein